MQSTCALLRPTDWIRRRLGGNSQYPTAGAPSAAANGTERVSAPRSCTKALKYRAGYAGHLKCGEAAVRPPQFNIRVGFAEHLKSSEAAYGRLASCIEQIRRQLEQLRHRQPDHVPIVSLDPLHERRAPALDRIGTGALAPFAAREIPVDQRLVQDPE